MNDHAKEVYYFLSEILTKDFKYLEDKDYFLYSDNKNDLMRIKLNTLFSIDLKFYDHFILLNFNSFKNSFLYTEKDISKLHKVISQIIFTINQINFVLNDLHDKCFEIIEGEK